MPPSTAINNRIGAGFGLLGFAVFAVHDVIVKHLSTNLSTFQIVFFSALLSFPIITLVLIRDEKPGTLRPHHPWWVALRSISGTASGLCAFYAVGALQLSEFYAFLFASPLLITVLAIPMLGETVRLRRGLAVVVGLIGVLIVLRPGTSDLNSGHIAALAAAAFSALASIVMRKVGQEERRVVMILYPMLTNLAVAGAMLPFFYVPLPLSDLGLLAVDSLLVVTAMGMLVIAYSKADAILVAPMQYSQIVWAALFGVFLFEEYPVWQTYLGTAVIAASGLYILKREATSDVSRNTPVLETRTRMGHSLTLRVSAMMRRMRGE